MKKIVFLVFILIFIFSAVVYSDPEFDPLTDKCIANCDYQKGDYSKIDWDKADQSQVPINRIKDIPAEKVDVTKVKDPYSLTKDQLAYNDNLNKFKQWEKLNDESLGYALTEKTGKSVSIKNPTTGEVTQRGFSVANADFIKIDETSINNCISCFYDGKMLKFQHADSFITGKSASTNINNFEGYADSFKMEKADSLLSGCIRVDNIKDSEFRVGNKIEITTKSNVNLKITDCSYNEFEFKGKGRITIDKNENPAYTVENGTLTKKENGYNETIDSNNSAIIETDKTFGFKCITITPAGSYFYNDDDLRKDFIINVPKESSVYRLCLKKSIAQQFNDYDGIVDFANKKIELNKIANYLKYPLKNNKISSLLSNFVYKGLKNLNAVFSYDNDLIFLNDISLNNKSAVEEGILSTTYPSNYYREL